MRSWICLGLALSSLPALAAATTYHIEADGGGEYPTIQAAIDVCAPGDTVLCGPGTYSGPGNINIYFHGVDLVLLSLAGREATVIDGQWAVDSPALRFTGGETLYSIVDGFTIRNCLDDLGGGVGLWNESSVTLRNLIIEDCVATGFEGSGGGIFAFGSSFTLEYSVVRNCYSESAGGGVRCLEGGNPRITDCAFEGNTSFSGGGGLSIQAPTTAILQGLVFRHNFGGYGGGLSVGTQDSLLVEGLIFEGNWARNGGGLSCGASFVRVSDCSFYRNSADRNGSGRGGGLIVSGSNVEIVRSCFAYNEAATEGAGIFVQDTGISLLDRLIVAEGWGGPAIAWDGGGQAPMIVCIDAYGNAGGNYGPNIGDQTGTNGNISLDPLFCGGYWDDFSLELRTNSPCLPENNGCGVLMGAHGVGCVATAVPGGDAPPAMAPDLSCHPNPFNPTTEIRFTVLAAGPVTLTLHDVRGRELARLVDAATLSAGEHSSWWAGKDSEGSGLPSGIYLARLETAGGTRSLKLTLLE